MFVTIKKVLQITSITIKSTTDLFLTLLNNSQSYLILCASLKSIVTIQRAAQNAGQCSAHPQPEIPKLPPGQSLIFLCKVTHCAQNQSTRAASEAAINEGVNPIRRDLRERAFI